MIASSRRMVEELGITHRLLEADVFAGHIDLLEGDAVAAEHCLRAAYDGLREHGLGIDAAQAAALLGRALLVQERAEEAEANKVSCPSGQAEVCKTSYSGSTPLDTSEPVPFPGMGF